MTLYAVRIADGHEAVAILDAESITDLWWLVDQVTDPGTCEYKRLVRGGIVWEGPTDTTFPTVLPDDDEENDEMFFTLKGAELDEGLWNLLHATEGDDVNKGWKSLCMDLEEVIPELKGRGELKKQEVADFLGLTTNHPKH